MKVYISDIDGYLGAAVEAAFKKRWPAAVLTGSQRKAGAAISVGSPLCIGAALEADVVVLNLVSAMVESQAIVEALRAYIANLPVQEKKEDEEEAAGDDAEAAEKAAKPISKTVIAISSVLCWDRTTSLAAPFEEAAYKRRRPGMKTADVRDTEIAVMALARPDKGVRTHVVAAGMPYGGGWGPLFPLLRRAWLCIDNAPAQVPAAGTPVQQIGLPVPCIREERGKNKLATIHVQDLASFIVKVSSASTELQPEPTQGEYFVAVDESVDTLVDICAAVSKQIGCGGTRLLTKEESFVFFEDPDAKDIQGSRTVEPSSKPHIGVDETLVSSAQIHLSAALNFDVASASIFADGRVSLGDDVWHARGGIVAHIEAVCGEFVRAHDLRPLRLVVMGPPAARKTLTAAALASKYQVPCISSKYAIGTVRSGNLRSLSDGSAERLAALSALREAVEKMAVDHDNAVAAAASAAEKSKKKDSKKKDEVEINAERGFRLPRQLFARVIRAILLSPECRNKGWVLDGIPRTWAEADAIFEAIPEGEDGISFSEGETGTFDSTTASKEEAEDDAACVSEATRKHIAISVLGTSLTSAPVPAVGAGGEAEGEEREGEEEGEGAEGLPKKESEPRLRPNAAVVLDAEDVWLEARELEISGSSAGSQAKERFLRRLHKYRLHGHPSLARTSLGWLESNAKVDACELRSDVLVAQIASEETLPTPPEDAAPGEMSVGAAVALARKYASNDQDEDARIAAAASRDAASGAGKEEEAIVSTRSAFLGLSADTTVPSELEGTAAKDALRDLALLKYAATFVERGGRPKNFHPTPAEQKALDGVLQQRQMRRNGVIEIARRAHDAEEQRVRGVNAGVQAEHAAAAARAEAALLEARTAPLRAYLLANVIPHITAGLIEVCKAGPVDPVDYLADFLFKAAIAEETKAQNEA